MIQAINLWPCDVQVGLGKVFLYSSTYTFGKTLNIFDIIHPVPPYARINAQLYYPPVKYDKEYRDCATITNKCDSLQALILRSDLSLPPSHPVLSPPRMRTSRSYALR